MLSSFTEGKDSNPGPLKRVQISIGPSLISWDPDYCGLYYKNNDGVTTMANKTKEMAVDAFN